MNRINAHDWKVFQRSVAAEVDRVILCSDDDVRRSGIPNAVAVPNTYGRPERSLGRREVGTPPTILFQGSLHYGPNIDAVDWLIDDVAPRLWEQLPGAQIRLVGTTSPAVEKRHRPPAVVVAGRVPEIEPELARADVAVVPLRIGSGTRLKILESFAHRIPVVSTTIGADGLDVEDGVHLLLADRPEEFARCLPTTDRGPGAGQAVGRRGRTIGTSSGTSGPLPNTGSSSWSVTWPHLAQMG